MAVILSLWYQSAYCLYILFLFTISQSRSDEELWIRSIYAWSTFVWVHIHTRRFYEHNAFLYLLFNRNINVKSQPTDKTTEPSERLTYATYLTWAFSWWSLDYNDKNGRLRTKMSIVDRTVAAPQRPPFCLWVLFDILIFFLSFALFDLFCISRVAPHVHTDGEGGELWVYFRTVIIIFVRNEPVGGEGDPGGDCSHIHIWGVTHPPLQGDRGAELR